MERKKSAEADEGAAPDGKELFIGADVQDAGKNRPATAATLRQEDRAVRKFIWRMIAFLTPLLLVIAGIELLLWRVGETWPLERVIRYQEKNPRSFYSRAVIDQGTFRYKYLQILRRHPRILVLGSSRVMQFRAEMFGRDASSFYNAGGMIHSIDDLNNFLDRLPQDASPRIMILGLDYWWLNANAKNEENDAFDVGVEEEGTYSWQGHANLLSTYVRQPRSLAPLITHSVGKKYDPNAIGLHALLEGVGFRPDGSKRFALRIPKTPEAWARRLPNAAAVERNILAGGGHFAFTDGVSSSRLEDLRATLLKIKARGVSLIVYSPPVITEWARVASTGPRQKEFWKEYHENLPAFFQSLDIAFFDVATPKEIGLDDRYMRDPYHAHDPFDMRVLQRFCERPEVRAAFPDVPTVAQKALASPRTNPLYLDLPGADDSLEDESR